MPFGSSEMRPLPGNRQEPIGRRAVGPERDVHVIRDDARSRLMILHRAEQPGLAQPAREVGLRLRAGVRHQAIDLMGPIVVHQEQLAVVALSEGDQVQRRPRELPDSR